MSAKYIQSKTAKKRGKKTLHIINPKTGAAWCALVSDGIVFDDLPDGFRACRSCKQRRENSMTKADIGGDGFRKSLFGKPLSPRETEVLTIMASDMKMSEIADKIGIKYNTIKSHSWHIYCKLGVRDRTSAIMKALRMGIIALPDERIFYHGN